MFTQAIPPEFDQLAKTGKTDTLGSPRSRTEPEHRTSRDLAIDLSGREPEGTGETKRDLKALTTQELQDLDPKVAELTDQLREKFGENGLLWYSQVMRAAYLQTGRLMLEAAPEEFSSTQDRDAFVKEMMTPLGGTISALRAMSREIPEEARETFIEIFHAAEKYTKNTRLELVRAAAAEAEEAAEEKAEETLV